MDKSVVKQLAAKMNRAGVPGDYGSDMSRLLSHIWKEIARGKPVTPKRVDEIMRKLRVSKTEAETFLREKAERDDNDNIIGIVGLSQDEKWAHRLKVNGVDLRTWCAWDQFFLAQVLDQTVFGESICPVSQKKIHIAISPDGVETCDPPETVVSIVTLDPDKYDKRKLEELWSGLWCKIYYFASREEARQWAKDKEEIAILTPDEAFELGRLAFSKLIATGKES